MLIIHTDHVDVFGMAFSEKTQIEFIQMERNR